MMNKKNTLLLIDDEVDLVEMTKFQLESQGYEVTTAYNGEEGLEKLKNMKPDLIVLDINMPKMGGIEFYNQICGYDNKPDYPILILTARANMEEFFKQFDVDGFMSKPFEVDELSDEIKMIIRKKSRIAGDSETRKRIQKVCIVENDSEILNQISSKLLSEGYILYSAPSGASGIELMTKEVPDLALINIRQTDISGDIVITKLKRLAKTAHVQYVLYTKEGATDLAVIEEMRHKEGIDYFLESADPKEIIQLIHKIEGGA